MRIDTHITSCPCKALMFPIWYMFICLQVYILFGQPEIYNVDDFFSSSRTSSYEKVFRFDIAIYQMTAVYIFYPM